jgi:hypothetical protein
MRPALLLSVTLLASTLWTAGAARSDTLLGSAEIGLGGGSGDAPLSALSKIAFEFGFDSGILGPACTQHRIGCEGIPLAQLVPGSTFDFTPSNSQYFAEVAGKLTNGVADKTQFANRLFRADGSFIFASGGGGATEAQFFQVPLDFAGHTITRLRLRLEEFAIGDQQSQCGGQPGGICYNSTFLWEIYGDPAATPAQAESWGTLKEHYR